MHKSIIFILLASFLILNSCDGTYVNKHVIASEYFSFKHAGKDQKVLFELKEIEIITRRNGLFRPGRMSRNVQYNYAIYASVADGKQSHEIYEFPCNKDYTLSDFVQKIKIKRNKSRSHFCLGDENNRTIGVFGVLNGVTFLQAYPLDPQGFEYLNYNEIAFDLIEKPRTAIKAHINAEKKLLLSDKQLYHILKRLSPQDELNMALSYHIDEESVFSDLSYQQAIIDYNRKDKNWKKTALSTIKNKSDKLNNKQFIHKLYAIGGMEEVVKEDEYQLRKLKNNGNFAYFEDRLAYQKIIIGDKIKNELRDELIYQFSHPNNKSFAGDFDKKIELAKKVDVQNPFGIFIKTIEEKPLNGELLQEYNDDFLFPSVKLGEQDKRLWVDYMVKHFGKIKSYRKSWAYKRIEEHITCEQKRKLLTSYKKDIDTFDDMEIPECR